jgi:hypothetical protein
MYRENLWTHNVRYWVRSFAIKGTDTAYSAALTTFMTLNYNGPQTTFNAPNFTALNSATVIMSLTAINDTALMLPTAVTARDTIDEAGIVWAFDKASPVLTDNKVVSKLKKIGTDTLTVPTTLTQAGNLVVRSFATSLSGRTIYGTAQTVNVNFPSGVTLDTLSATDTSAILRGRLDFNGGVVLAEAGFEYSTDPTFATSDVVKATTAPTGAFQVTTPGTLTPGTVYYFKSYYINRFGLKSEGAVRTFRTRP